MAYDGSRPHAVTAAHGNSYGYDGNGNGNQTSRTVGGTNHTLTFDYENRLTAISGGSTDASFVYDADGNRVRGTVNGETTVYIGGIYEYSPVPTNLTLSNQTLSGTTTYEADTTLTVSSGAGITFRAVHRPSTTELRVGLHRCAGAITSRATTVFSPLCDYFDFPTPGNGMRLRRGDVSRNLICQHRPHNS